MTEPLKSWTFSDLIKRKAAQEKGQPSAATLVDSSTVESTRAENTLVDSTVEVSTIAETTPSLSKITTVADSTIAGFTRVPNVIFDRVIATLKPSDQSVLLRLYRLSHGFGKDTCTVGYGTLSRACNISIKQAQICIERLEQTGLIKRLRVEQGGKSRYDRGSEYRVNLPTASATVKTTTAKSAIAETTDNKEKALKEISKGIDASLCPDCNGTGFFYPEGIGHGVAKCKHPKLKRK